MGWLPRPTQVLLAGPQTLTNETTSGTTEEQWGTEELVISTVPVGSNVTVLAHLTGNANRNETSGVSAERGILSRLQVSLDGGSTWSTTSVGSSYVDWHGNEETGSAIPVSAQVLHSGTVTGTIQVRAMVTTYHTAGKPVARDGAITATITY